MTDRFFFYRPFSFLGIAVAVILIAICGCKPEEKVVRHRIPKNRSGLEALRAPVESTAETTEAATERMVVALYELEDSTWFFKINGTIDQVNKTETEWKPFFSSMKFESGEPQWELPTGWSPGTEKPMRFATLTLGEFDPPLEMAISRLGPNQDLVLNVNRWRGQMGLKEITDVDFDDTIKKLDSSETSPWFFDVVGKSSGGMMAPSANRPMAKNPHSTDRPLAPTQGTAAEPSKTGPSFDIPTDWETGNTSAMVPVRLTKSVGEKKAQITIVAMPAAANEWEPNAKRWAGELGMTEVSAEELKALCSAINVDGSAGQLITLTEPESDTDRATIAGMVKRDGTAWFLKLTGDKELVVENENVFSDFLNSLKFPTAN